MEGEISKASSALKQASEILEKCEEKVNQSRKKSIEILQTVNKFEHLTSSFPRQLEILAQILTKTKVRETDISLKTQQLSRGQLDIDRDLEQIFKDLQKQKVDPQLHPTNTLYDYVDLETVKSLQLEVAGEINVLKMLEHDFQQTNEQIKKEASDIQKLSNQMNENFQKWSSLSFQENLNQQTKHLNGISDAVMDIATLHDRLKFGSALFGFEQIRTETNKLPNQLANVYEASNTIDQLINTLTQHIQKAPRLSENCMELLSALEGFTKHISAKVQTLDHYELDFLKHFKLAKFMSDELQKLLFWYQQYYRCYPLLLQEMQRRSDYERKVQKIRDTFEKQLDEIWNYEVKKRNQWNQDSGTFLPPDLAPDLYQAPQKLVIIPK